MRNWIKIVEDASKSGESQIGSSEWRAEVLKYARDEDQSGFTILRPEETGLPMSGLHQWMEEISSHCHRFRNRFEI